MSVKIQCLRITMRCCHAGDKLLLGWPLSSGSFVLEQSSDLARENWTEVSATPTLVDGDFQFEVNVGDSIGGNRFYRLRTK